MRLSRSVRWLLLALAVFVLAAPSYAGVFISVNFAPPVMPVYEQPLCPAPDLMWTPGYWAYGPDGYYWVPGAWVPAPYEGALWTPGYWGWSGGLFVWHEGYWGRHVGYYGGVNYGFGYMGIGFVGGEWRPGGFHYNTAIMHVDGRYVHNTFVNREIVERSYVSRDSRVAFNGGPGGIRHEAGPEERMAEHEQHMGYSPVQQQHMLAARNDHGAYVKNNGGRPQNLAVARPLGATMHDAPGTVRPVQPAAHGGMNAPAPGYQGGAQSHPPQAGQISHPMAQPQAQPQQRPAPQSYPSPQPQSRPSQPPQPQQHPAAQPQPHPAPAQHAPAPAPHPAPAPKAENREKDKR